MGPFLLVKGGQVTISPPAKVKTSDESAIILASGIDTLYLTINVEWASDQLFTYLADLKEQAINLDSEVSGDLASVEGEQSWPFEIKCFGSNGYEWILLGKEFVLKIGNWLKPKSRPSVMVEIGSETLWHLGPVQTVQKILNILLAAKGTRLAVKASRIDLCVDLLLPADLWHPGILDYAVTRAHDLRSHWKHGKFTGFGVGKGKLSARLYDKALEIETKSKKYWLFDIWGLTEIPEGYKAIRVEYQLRRQAITELGMNCPDDVFQFGSNAWAYCSQYWLKFQDRPGTHHTQRNTLPWWQQVQTGYQGAQNAHPLIRAKALRADKKQIMQQAFGLLSSLTAIQQEELHEKIGTDADLAECLMALFNGSELLDAKKRNFGEKVTAKRAKYSRSKQKAEEVAILRRSLGFPNN